MNGSLFLRAGLLDGQTVLLESCGTYPLQVARPQRDMAGSLSLVVLLLSGGLLDGDCISMDIVVERGARLAVRTQAATQVHAGRSTQRLQVTVAEDGCFSYVPHAVVPHARAVYHGQNGVVLAEGARALIADVLSPGRVQFGECFAYQEVRLDLDARAGSRPLARERAVLRPDIALRGAQLGAFSHVAGAYMLGPGEAPHVAAGGPDVRIGASELARGGWFVRALADRATTLDQLLAGLSANWWAVVQSD
ncbi:MAG TPA: urease accessory protein UreD [Chloroflexota bacterium]|nr:urease accessory protein UreD [Chloroflexota bacterium]